MALDTNIALGVRPIEQPNMLAQMGQMMQLRQAQQQYESENALRDLAVKHGGDISNPAFIRELGTLNPKMATDLRSKQLEQQQKGVETGIKINEALSAALGGLAENPTLDYARNTFSHLVSTGVLPPDKAQAMFAKLEAEPGRIKEYATLGVNAAISAEKKLTNATTIRGQDLTHSASMAHVGATIRGQNQAERHWQYDIDNPKMTPLAGEKVVNGEKIPAYFGYDPRNNSMIEVAMPTVSVGAPTTLPTNAYAPPNVNALSMPPAGAPTSPVARPATVATPSAVAPSAAIPSAAAPTSVVPGAPNAPAQVRFGPKSTAENLTEAQGKSTGFALRAKQASDILDIVGKDGKVQPGVLKRVGESVPLVGEGLGTMLNVTQTPQQQQIEQAQRAFVNAILRQESGAAINESEFVNAKKQYFPQPGDSKEVIEQKRLNRETAVRSLEVAAGPGMKQAAPATGIKVGTVEDGYRFKGGDPANKNNWEKQ
jgi:hypothetical protein